MNTAGSGTPSDTGVFRTAVPRALVGSSFGELLAYFAQRRGHDSAGIPIAVCRGSQVFVNPKDDRFAKLQEGDVLFVIRERLPTEAASGRPAQRASVA